MAKILKRTWSSTGPLGRKVRHVAYGYTFYRADGERERKVSSDWLTEHEALTALMPAWRRSRPGSSAGRPNGPSTRSSRSTSSTSGTTASAP